MNSTTARISLIMPDEQEEETYRRIAGNPSFVCPSFSSTSDSAHRMASTTSTSQSFAPKVFPKEADISSCGKDKVRWTLQKVPTLPEFHTLEKTAVFVPQTSPSIVSERISDALRKLSIEASYDGESAKARCVTIDGVHFNVFLYRGKRQYNHGIIVEVQRDFGNSINFYTTTTAILDASKGREISYTNFRSDALPIVPDENDSFNPNTRSSLDFVSKMLSHPAFDAQYLGLQSLDFLTDPSKVEISTSRNISKEIMQPDNDIGRKVTNIILTDQSILEKTNSHPNLRPMAMNILSNVLIMVPVENIPKDTLQGLLTVFQKELMNAGNNPRIAHITTKCVKQLIIGQKEIGALFESALESSAQVGYSK